MESILNGLGIETCKDVIDRRRDICYLFTKTQANFLLHSCNGISSGELDYEESSEGIDLYWEILLDFLDTSRHSISNERTFTPTNDRNFLNEKLKKLICSVYETLVERGYIGCSKITVKVKFSTFKETSKTQSLIEPVILDENVFKIAKVLLDKILGEGKTNVSYLVIEKIELRFYFRIIIDRLS